MLFVRFFGFVVLFLAPINIVDEFDDIDDVDNINGFYDNFEETRSSNHYNRQSRAMNVEHPTSQTSYCLVVELWVLGSERV